MEMDAALGNAGGAAGKGDDRRVVGGGVDRGQGLKGRDPSFELAVPIIAVIFDEVLDEAGLLHGIAEVADVAAVDDGVTDFGAVDDGRDLAGAQEWHGGDHNSAGLQDAEPGCEHHVAIGPAQEDAIAGERPVSTSKRAILPEVSSSCA